MKVLFIGNSFTFYNKMPTDIFGKIAEDNGNPSEVLSVTKGGYTLSRYADPEDELGAKVKGLLDTVRFDAVIIQEQSHTPISAPEKFYSAVRALCSAVRKNGATPYLYATWGYHPQHERISLYGKDTQDMEMKLRTAYSAIGEELEVAVCHVGAAMTYAHENSDMTIYKPDLYHPALPGSVIAAATVYSRIFGALPSESSLSALGLAPTEKRDVIKAVSHVFTGT